MSRGKSICRILKQIRQQVAADNDIELVIKECHFQGECQGTCPRCEAEVAYLERELEKRRMLGKVVTIGGLAGLTLMAPSCTFPTAGDPLPPEREDNDSLILLTTQMDIPVGMQVQIEYRASDSTAIEWFSSDAHVASVDSTGLVSALREGQATILARLGEIFQYCRITVVDEGLIQGSAEEEPVE